MKKIIVLLILSVIGYKGFSQSVINSYVDENKKHAIDLMNQCHVIASIILRVAIHENAAGTSKIALYLNDHFGIKDPNSNTQIKSAYKGYEGSKDSYLDFVDKLQTRSKYKILFDKHTDYEFRQWAVGIQPVGFENSKTWATRVIAIVKKHRLYEFDNRPESYTDVMIKNSTPLSKPYTVKSGDTLGAIAKAYCTHVKNLIQNYGLKTSVLQIGQKLKI